jgi:hypothetical protein
MRDGTARGMTLKYGAMRSAVKFSKAVALQKSAGRHITQQEEAT